MPVALLVGLVKLASIVHPGFPIHRWMVWRYVSYWLITAAWATSCFCFGHAVLRRVLRSPLPVLEHVTFCFATGTLSFFMLMFAGGLAMAYGPLFFIALPLAMTAFGGPRAWRYLRRLRRHLIFAASRNHRRLKIRHIALPCLGLVAIFLFYLPGIVPSNVGYDSSWYHLPLAEHYARLGGIRRLAEGWYMGAIPHLPSVIYCWAFLVPRSGVFDYVELSAHLEFATMLMMLPGIPALVRRLAPGLRAHASWVAFFTFPSVYWYDLLVGGDQFSALWSAPIALALLRVLPTLGARNGLLLAMMIAGETLTKYSASGILIFPAAAVTIRALWLGALAHRRGALAVLRAFGRGAFIAAAVLLLTSPLWLKNWIWYGDPFHPLLHAHFSSHPWTEDATTYFNDYVLEMATNWQPPHTWEGVKSTLEAVANHSFAPADFPPDHATVPLRGSLFTLMCACIPFVRAPWRLWAAAAFGNVAILGWYWQMHPDRYLMAFMPLMAAVASAVIVLAWRSSLPARLALLALVGFHTVWGLRVFTLWYPQGQYKHVMDFLAAAPKDGTKAGMSGMSDWIAVSKTLPKEAKVLVHGMHAHLGIGRPSVSDWPRTQTGISYGRLPSAAAMFEQMRDLGVTHFVWKLQTWPDSSIASDLRFYEFVAKYTEPKVVDDLIVGTMPAAPPPQASGEELIAFFGCNDSYKAGLYPFADMTVPNPRGLPQPPYPEPREEFNDETDVEAMTLRAKFLVFNSKCEFKSPSKLDQDFLGIYHSGDNVLYARREP